MAYEVPMVPIVCLHTGSSIILHQQYHLFNEYVTCVIVDAIHPHALHQISR